MRSDAAPLPEVTVILPTRNRWHCLQRVLPTYFAQEAVRQVILIDDASEPPLDESTLGAPAGKLRIERMPSRQGAPNARNLGARLAETDWLLFSDDDVFLAPDYLSVLFATQSRTSADIVGGRRIYLLDGETPEAALARCNQMSPEVYDPRFVEANFSAPLPDDTEVLHLQTTSLARRSVALEVGWDTGYRPTSYREETDFFLRAAETGYRIAFSAGGVCYHLSPADTSVGGQRANSWWQYELGVVRNNHRFLERHYSFLRSQQAIEGSRCVAECRFAWWRLWGGFCRDQYRRYYQSSLRPLVGRLRGRTPVRG